MNSDTHLLDEGIALHNGGAIAQAAAIYRQVLARNPGDFDALHLLGVVALQTGDVGQAADFIGKALAILPTHAPAHFNHALALTALERLDAAVGAYDACLMNDSANADAWNNRGHLLWRLGRPTAALESYDQCITADPNHAGAYNNRGIVLADLGRYDDACAAYTRAIALNPTSPHAHNNHGLALAALNRHTDALLSYEQALALKPGYAEAYNSRANSLAALGRPEDALAAYDRAVDIDPNYAEAFANRGGLLATLKHYEAAVGSYETAWRLNPEHPFLAGALLHAKASICDWRGFEAAVTALEQSVARGARATPPWPFLAVTDSPALQRVATETWVDAKYPAVAEGSAPYPTKPPSDKIRLGYFSADFHNHATAHLMADMFECHDRARFELLAFSFGPEKDDGLRRRIRRAFDHFLDVRERSDADIAALARELGLDIAIDLKGFTRDARPGIFRHLAAPLQVNYLGYPGTMGAAYIDYLIADATVIPQHSRPHYAEHIVTLPHCYQPNDRRREVAAKNPPRTALGLPEQGFVFCCFNSAYKITPAIFEVWIRILLRVPNSVLWLLDDNAAAVVNLRSEAQRRGLGAERLVFAPRLAPPEHLARHAAAGLFLDTLPGNAHTTASDALWGGLPVLTCRGTSLNARVASSLLTALDLPELIVPTLSDYEETAVALACDPARLDGIRTKLAQARLTTPLFDTPLFTRHIEAAYEQMLERRRAGLLPDHIQIAS